MNHLLAALAFVSSMQQPPLSPRDAASQAAVQAFTEACIKGQFKLTPERGRIIKEYEETPFTAVLPSTWSKTRRVIVKLNYPPQTYLVFGDFGHLQPHSIASACILASGSIRKNDAIAALLATAPGTMPEPTNGPSMEHDLSIDQPEKGFRSRMEVRDDGSIILEVAMYNGLQAKH